MNRCAFMVRNRFFPAVLRIRLCMGLINFENPGPDRLQKEKLDPNLDEHQIQNQDLHQSQSSKDVEA
jgi:hypothetical protein